MKILFSPQVRDNEKIIYEFQENSFTATHNGKTETFDFEGAPNGRLEMIDEETGEPTFETELDVNPIEEAEKKDGTLYLKLLNFIGPDATEAECFPDWIDAEDYTPPELPKEEEVQPDAAEG